MTEIYGLGRLLTTKQTAEVLSLSVQATGKLLRAGEIPGIRIRRQWRVPVAELEIYLQRKVAGR